MSGAAGGVVTRGFSPTDPPRVFAASRRAGPLGSAPQLEALQATVDTAVQQLLDTVTTNPVVESLLGDLVGSLPLSGLPVPLP